MSALAVVVFAAFGLVGFASAEAIGSAPRAPHLELVRLAPLTIRGTGFKPAERVRLIVTADGVATRRVSATQLGRFVVRLAIRPGRCTDVVVQAFGAAGSRAMIDRPTPDCMEP